MAAAARGGDGLRRAARRRGGRAAAPGSERRDGRTAADRGRLALKILEALASGLPVVSTRIGAEGLRLEDGRDLTVVERPEDMAAALVRCIRAPDEARRMTEHGRRVVRERYDWDVLADRLGAVWESVVGETMKRVEAPCSSFT